MYYGTCIHIKLMHIEHNKNTSPIKQHATQGATLEHVVPCLHM